MPSYRWFKVVKYRYHILGVEFVDKSGLVESIKRASARMNNPLPKRVVDTMEAEAKYFVVHIRSHIRHKTFERSLMIPFGLATDELGAYSAVQEITSGFATMIKPKG